MRSSLSRRLMISMALMEVSHTGAQRLVKLDPALRHLFQRTDIPIRGSDVHGARGSRTNLNYGTKISGGPLDVPAEVQHHRRCCVVDRVENSAIAKRSDRPRQGRK